MCEMPSPQLVPHIPLLCAALQFSASSQKIADSPIDKVQNVQVKKLNAQPSHICSVCNACCPKYSKSGGVTQQMYCPPKACALYKPALQCFQAMCQVHKCICDLLSLDRPAFVAWRCACCNHTMHAKMISLNMQLCRCSSKGAALIPGCFAATSKHVPALAQVQCSRLAILMQQASVYLLFHRCRADAWLI